MTKFGKNPLRRLRRNIHNIIIIYTNTRARPYGHRANSAISPDVCLAENSRKTFLRDFCRKSHGYQTYKVGAESIARTLGVVGNNRVVERADSIYSAQSARVHARGKSEYTRVETPKWSGTMT